ncbi:MAG: response regulator [Chloroflexi bacterium]|nr:response regulator [Chloroflexota bacterium]
MKSGDNAQSDSKDQPEKRGLLRRLFGGSSDERGIEMDSAGQADAQDGLPGEQARVDQTGVDQTAMNANPATAESAVEAVESLERTLGEFESVIDRLEQRAQRPDTPPDELAGLRGELRAVVQELEGAVARLGGEAERLADGASDLAHVSGALQTRLGELAAVFGPPPERGTGWPAPEQPGEAEPEAAAPEAPVPEEPKFWLGDQPLGIVIAAVQGFQELMNLQKAMSALPGVSGASVVGYKDGEAALDYVFRRGQYQDVKKFPPPDLILLDIRLPKLNGPEVLDRLKGDSVYKQIPVVMLTSSKSEEDIVKSYKSGAASYIPKPIDYPAFAKVVEHFNFYWHLSAKLPRSK